MAVLTIAAAIIPAFLVFTATAFAAEEPVVRAGSELDFRPYAFTDANGQPTGFGVELLTSVAEKMGLRLRITPGPWDEVWSRLVAGKLDVLPVVARTPGREPLVDFTLPHTETFDAFFVREGRAPIKDLAAAAGKEIVVLRSDAAHHQLVERKFSGKIVPVESITEGLRMIAAGKYDAMLCSRLVGVLERDQAGIKGVKGGPAIADYKRVFSFAVRKGNADLVEQLNQGLLMVKRSGEYDRMYEKWLSVDDPWRRYSRYVAPVLFALLGTLVVSVCLLLLLRRLVRKRTAQLAETNRMLEQERAELEGKVLRRTQDLSRSEARLKSFSEATFEGIARSEAGRIIDCNDQLAQMLGYPPSELKDHAIADLIPPEDRERVLENIGENRESTVEHAMVRKDGTRIIVEAHGRPVEPGSTLRHTAVRDITKRKRAEEALAAAHGQIQSIIDNTPALVYAFDLEERFVMANTAIAELLNSTPEQMIGKRRHEFMPKEDADWHETNDRRVIETGRALEFEEYSQLKGRSITWLTTKFPLRDAQGRIYAVAGTSADITERKQAEAQLTANLAAMTRLQKLATMVVHEGDTGPVLGEIVDAAIAISKADFGNIQLLDPKTSDLRIAAYRGLPQWWIDYWDNVSKGEGTSGTALERGERVIVEDVEQSPIFVGTPALDIQREAGVRAVQSTPLVSRSGMILGMFSTHYRTPSRPDERALRLLDLLARQAADVIERVQADKALRASETRLSSLYATMTEGLASHEIVYADGDAVDYVITDANPAFEKITGIPREFAVGKRATEVYGTETAPYLDVYARVASAGVPENFETYFPPMEKHFAISVFSPGKGRFATVFSDITGRKQADEALQASEQRMQLALDVSRSFTFDWHPDTDLVLRSASCGQILGLFGDEVCNDTGRNFFQCIHPDDGPRFVQMLSNLTPSRSGYSTEYRVVRNDGTVVVLEEVGQGVFNDAGRLERVVGVATDITRRKQVEGALKWTARRNELLSATAARLLQTDDPQGLIEELCHEVMKFLRCHVFFNYMQEEGKERLRLNACAGIPEEQARRIQTLDYGVAVCGCVARDGAPTVAEDILNTPDPRTELVKSLGVQSYCCHPMKVQNRVIGTLSFGSRTQRRLSDEEVEVMKTVTDLVAIAMHRIKTQKALQRSERLYRAIGESINYGIWVCGPDGRNIYASESFLRLVGSTQQQCSEFGWGDVLHPDDAERTIAAWKECVRTAGTWDIEHRFRGTDGQWHPILARGVPVRDDQGEIICWAGINLDISRLKQTEESLRQSQEDLDRAQAVGQIGWWRLDIRRNVLTWSDENHRMFGVPKGTPLTYETFLEAIHPEDRQYVDMMWQAGLRGEPYDIEHRIVVGGQVKWVREKAYLEFSESGTLLGGFGITQDITQRREAEESLRRAREALQKANEELEERIRQRTGDLRRANRDLEERSRDLNERVKELNCLYIVSYLLTEETVPLAAVLQEVVNVVPSGWQFPELTGALIALNGIEVKTPNYRDTHWRLERRIYIQDSVEGTITVAYCDEPPALDSDPFLKEEESLIGTIAHMIGDFVERLRNRTMLKESESKYRRVSRQFNALLDALPDMLLLLSPDLRVLWTNRTAAARAGLTSEALVGRTCQDFWSVLAVSGDCPAMTCFESGQTTTARLGRAGGSIWDVIAVPVKDESGKVRNAILVARDITRELRLQEEAVRSARLASLGELAAGVAHEINNPINSIINYAQILENRTERPSQEEEFSQEIIKEGERIARIVQGLLGFARDTGDAKHPVALRNVLDATLVLTNSQVKRDGIRLTVKVPDDLPPVQSNEHQLQQVLLNLISNARFALNKRYEGPHPDKTLEINCETLPVEGRPHVRIEVRDRGTGIPRHLLDRVTAPFFTTKPPSEGTGLGLSICAGIVANHGGRLTVESAEGAFTRVIIDLPAKVPEESP